MAKTVVTGGTGFIGSHLVKSLIDKSRDVAVASDFACLGLENLINLGIDPDYIDLRHTDLTLYNQALEAVAGADTVFHLAARVGSVEYLHGGEFSELSALQTNLLIDANVFKACIETGVEKIIYASSCAVYPLHKQTTLGTVFSESDLDITPLNYLNPAVPESGCTASINPDGGYGWAKLLGEIQLSFTHGTKIGIARIFNVYGINEPLRQKAHVVADLTRKVITYPQQDFVVWGDGTQTRDFLYVTDCVDAFIRIETALDNYSNNSSDFILVNIGADLPVDISSVAKTIISISGKDIPINYDTSKPVGPISRTANTDKAKRLLHWQPQIDMNEGLKLVYTWIEKELKK